MKWRDPEEKRKNFIGLMLLFNHMLALVNYNADDVTFSERKMIQSISKFTIFRDI
jgi:hypothetical protein